MKLQGLTIEIQNSDIINTNVLNMYLTIFNYNWNIILKE